MKTSIVYHIRVKGQLDSYWAEWFDDLAITHEANGNTLLSGPMIDQAALYGVLLKIHSLNLTLLSLNRMEVAQPSP